MQLHQLQPSKGIKKARRIGRGGKRGKTSGKGTKGQKARAGRKIRPAERDTIKRIPKRRGHGKNRARTVNASRIRPETVSLSALEQAFSAGDRVTPKELVAKGLVRARSGRVPTVKVLANGSITKKVTLADCEYSASAKEAIVKAGGEVL